ncbi:MAG TPA: hypothetical protein VFS35_10910, partial [Terrimicrobiaceae bacterium]|nr:hypothetical protein [Terrimicrobiaceae bacterium]
MSTATLTGWNDDNRRKALAALIASLFIHLLIILSVTVVLSMRPPLVVPQDDEPPPVELTLVAPPEEQPKQKPAYVATSESQRADRPPEDSVFESDKDTHAASPLPAAGDAPVPTQDGRDIAALTFEDKEYTPGPVARPSTPAAQPRQEIRPQPETP